MKRVITIATLIASALSFNAAAVDAPTHTQGQVAGFNVICGDHFVQIQSVDNVLNAAAVDDVRAVGVTVAHKAKKGKMTADVYILMSAHPEQYEADGYVLHIGDTSGTLTPTNFKNNPKDPQHPIETATGPVDQCHAA